MPWIECLEDRCLPTVNVANSFPGMSFVDISSAATPPSPTIAVGPSVIVETVNTSIEILDKSGNVLMPAEDFSRFFGALYGPGDSFTDPYVVYDDLAQRFYVGTLEVRTTPAGGQFTFYDFAASNTADPMQASDWTVFQKITSIDDHGSEDSLYPQMGFNADAVFLSFDRYANDTENLDDLVLAIDKNSILNPGPGTNPALTTYQTSVNISEEQQLVIPAQMHGDTASVEYLVSCPDDSKTIDIISETDYLSANPVVTTTPIKVNAYLFPTGVPELTDEIDDSILSANWDNNKLVAAENVGLSSDTLTHARWYEFDTSTATPTLVQQGDLNPGPGINTSFASIGVDDNGDLAMTYIQSASDSEGNITQEPSMYITGWTPSDPLNAMEPGTLIQAGVTGAYAGFGGGQYSSTVLDPVDGSFWSVQEYAADDISTDDWGTGIANYTVGFGPLVSSVAPTTVQEGSNTATLTVSGSNFGASSVVLWNGTPVTTTWESATELAATVPGRLLVEYGTYSVSVQDPAAAVTNSNAVNVTVVEPPLKAGPAIHLASIQAGATFSGELATFTDPDQDKPIDDYVATISWGDATAPVTGTITALSPGDYEITSNHVYMVGGKYTITISITDEGLNPLTINVPITVVGSVLTATGDQITATANKSMTAVVAAFTDSATSYSASAYTALITWGDGIQSMGVIKKLGKGQFSVSGTHRYAIAGTYNITITIRRGTQAYTLVDSTADVGSPPPAPPKTVKSANATLAPKPVRLPAQ